MIKSDITTIRPGKLGSNFVHELITNRELIYYFAWREFKIRYKQTLVGILWVVFQPLFFAVVISLLLFRSTGISFGADIPVIIPVYMGLLFWNYFEQSLNNASNSLVNNQNIITKVYFPRFIPPLAAALAGLVDFLVAYIVLFVIMGLYGVTPHIEGILLTLPLLILAFLTTYGLGLLLATLNVKYRDIKFALPFVLRLMLFTTPVFYPITFLPEQYHWLLFLNPITLIIETFRNSMLGISMDINTSLFALSISMIVLFNVVGYRYFRNKEREFADIA